MATSRSAEGEGRDAAAWEAVAREIAEIARSVRPLSGRLRRGALHLRLAVLGLRRALAELDEGALAPAAGEGAEAPPSLDLLEVALEAQLSGGTASHPVLEVLPAAARAAALSEIQRALEADPDYKPALRALGALAMAGGDWVAAVRCHTRIAELPGMPETQADALQVLAQIHWRRLGEPHAARALLLRARDLVPDDLVLVDKLLKVDLELENWEDAVAACRLLVGHLGHSDTNPELAVTYLLTLGEIHCYGLKTPAAALGYYLEAVERRPEYPLTFSLMQDLLENHGEAALQVPGLEADDHPEADGRRRHLLDLLRRALNAHPGPQAAMRAFRDAVGFAAGR